MLVELNVRNLAVIQELRLELKPGLTVLSGDEGAGKSLVVDALCLLLGGKASPSMIRNGALAALVEGVFYVQEDDSVLETALRGAGLELEGDRLLILGREIQGQGRSIARVNGRAVPVSLLRDLGRRLVDVHGQMEHLSVLDSQHQLDLLDEYGRLLECRGGLTRKMAELREKRQELETLTGNGAERKRDLLAYQLAEIDGANIRQGEDEALEQERQVLERAEAIREACYRAYNALYGDEGYAAGLVHRAARELRGIMAIDPSLRRQLEALESNAAELEEIARELRCYAEVVDSSSDRLWGVEERLELLRRLKGKYGPSLEEVIEFAGRAGRELQDLQVVEERRDQMERQQRQLVEDAGKLAEKLSRARGESAQSLAEMVNRELSDLGIPWARFGISLKREDCGDGLPAFGGRFSSSRHGIDRAEFLGATNPGEPLRPLAHIASGGETCRFMLALKSALRRADSVPTLVFDEIDSGVGGRSAQAVGRKLAALAENRQVICVTHLPQIACFGHHHYRVFKEILSGRAVARAQMLDGDARVEELAAMLGGSVYKPMLESAQEFLRQARLAG